MSMELFENLVSELRLLPPLNLAAAATDLLLQPTDWSETVARFLEGMDDQEFAETASRSNVPDVEPSVYSLYSEPMRFEIVLNHFSLPRFQQHLLAGRITAHYHRFSFATRLLRGRYFHWVYQNQGDIPSPNLQLEMQEEHEAGHVYWLRAERFHCVLDPEDDTMTLMIRGAPELEAPEENPRRGRERPDLLSTRTSLIEGLRAKTVGARKGKRFGFERTNV